MTHTHGSQGSHGKKWQPRRHPALPPLKRREEMTEQGVIKFYDKARGYGFISRAGRPDVFLHNSVVNRYRLRETDLETDMPVRFLAQETSGRRPEAIAVCVA